MDLRVTKKILVARSIASARQQFDRLANLQEQAVTGKRLLRPSDGPLDAVTVLANKAQAVRLDTYLANVRDARTTLDLSVSALREAGNILSSARDTAIEASHAANSPEAFEVLAQQVDALIARLLAVANTQQAGRYLFGGTAPATKPFSAAAADGQGRPLAIAYVGSEEPAEELVGPDQTLATLYPGSQVFQQLRRETTVFTGDTGAAAGSGTDSATGQGTLRVRHTATTYAAGSGVQAGTSSPSGDTIIGPAGAHRLTVIDTSGTGAAGTVSLDGGMAIAFTSADTNLNINKPP